MQDDDSQRSGLAETGRDLLVYIPGVALPAVFGLVGVKVFTVVLPKGEYGLFTLAVTLVGLLSSAFFSHTRHSVVRFFSKFREQERTDEFITTALSVGAAMVLLVGAVSWLAYPWMSAHYPELAGLVPLIAGLTAVKGTASLVEGLQNASRRSNQNSLQRINIAAGKLGAGWYAVARVSSTAGYLLWGQLLAQVLVALGHLGWLLRSLGYRVKMASWSIARRMLAFGVPLMGSILAYWGLNSADRLLIEYFMNSEAVANYAVPYDLSHKGMNLVLRVIMLAGYPVVLQLYESGDGDEAKDLMSRLTGIYLYLGGLIAGLLAAFPRLWIRLLSDYSKYSDWAFLIPILAGTILLYFLLAFTVKGFELKEKTNYILALYGGGLALNIGLNIWLIPRYGETGAALATLASLLVVMAAGFTSFRFWSYDFPWRAVVRTVTVLIVLVGAGFYVDRAVSGDLRLLFAAPVWIGLYLGLQYLLGDRNLDYLPRMLKMLRERVE